MKTTFAKDMKVIYNEDTFATITKMFKEGSKSDCEIETEDGKKLKVLFADLEEIPEVKDTHVEKSSKPSKAKAKAEPKGKATPKFEEGDEDSVFKFAISLMVGTDITDIKTVEKLVKYLEEDDFKKGTLVDYLETIIEYDWKSVFVAMKKFKLVEEFNKIVTEIKQEKLFAKYMKEKKSKGGYWDNEEPVEIETGMNVFKFYEEAVKLQVYKKIDTPNYKGLSKGVVIDSGDCSEEEAIKIAYAVLNSLKSQNFDDRFQEIVESITEMFEEIEE